MTISTTTARVPYNGNGITTVFPIPFRFLVNDDIVVVRVDAAGVETTLVYTTDYTLTGAGGEAGGTVTMLVAPASGTRLIIYRDTDIVQETDYISGDPFPAETHERALDRLTMIAQEIGSDADRAIKVPVGDSSSLSTTLPAAASRLDKFLVFDSATGAAELSSVTHTQVASAVAAAYSAGGSTADAIVYLPEDGTATSVQAKMRESQSLQDHGTFAAALTAIGSTPTRLIVNTPIALTANVTIPSTLTLAVEDKGMITTTGYTLTINGPFECGLVQCFDGTGTVSFGNGAISEAYPQWWGAKGDLSADATDAINSAIAASTSVTLVGKYLVNGQINIDRNGVTLRGRGMQASQLKFNPASGPAVMINIEAATPTELIQQITLVDFGILATYPAAIKKTAIKISDGSFVLIENVNSVDYSWTGGTYSVLLSMCGRDQHTVRTCHFVADRPVQVGKNPNSAQYQFDAHHFSDLSLQTLDASQYAITFLPGVNISQWLLDGRSIALTGKGGIYFNDTDSGTASSSQITIDNFRVESGTASGGDAGGYGVYMDFGAGNPFCGNIRVTNSSVNDGSCNGYHFDRVSVLEMVNINCGFASGNAAITLTDVGFAELTAIGIGHDSAVVSTPSMNVRRLDRFYTAAGAPTNPSIAYGLYTLYDSDTPSRNIQYEDGILKWGKKAALANSEGITLPALASGGGMLVDVIYGGGYAKYFVGYAAASAVLIHGSAAFGVAGAGSITVIASGSGVSSITNVSAGAIVLAVSVQGT